MILVSSRGLALLDFLRWCRGFFPHLGRPTPYPLRFHSAYDGEALLRCRGRLNAYADNIHASQGGFFSIPIVDAGGNGSKFSSVFGDPLRFPPRAPRVQERNPPYHHGSGWNPMRCFGFSSGDMSSRIASKTTLN